MNFHFVSWKYIRMFWYTSWKWCFRVRFGVKLVQVYYLDLSWHNIAWWRHRMETFAVTGPLCWEFTGPPPPPPPPPPPRGTLMFSLICAWISGWANNRDAGDLRRHRAHYVVTVMGRKVSSRRLAFSNSDRRCGMKMISTPHFTGHVIFYPSIFVKRAPIESTKTTSMEDVSTEVLEKIKNI